MFEAYELHAKRSMMHSMLPDPLCYARFLLVECILASSRNVWEFTAESLDSTSFLRKEASTVEIFSREMSYLF